MTKPILEVSNLTCRLKLGKKICTVVEGLTYKLFLGKTLAVVGESGCGKTMSALAILRILPVPPTLPPEGEVLFQGKNLLQIPESELRSIRGARIAMIFQDPMTALNPVYSIGYQMMEVAELHLGLFGEEAAAKAAAALRDVGVASPYERLNDYPHQLSGGLRQRVMIAMALMCEPDILIADEPTTALDVTTQAQVLDLIRGLQKRKGMALLLITHDMGVVAEMADEVIVMYAAQGVEHGYVEDIFDHMGHPYTLGLFRSRPSAEGKGVQLKAIKGTVPALGHFPEGCRFHTRCPYFMDKCRHGSVPDFLLSEQHTSKCWLHDGTEESEERSPWKDR